MKIRKNIIINLYDLPGVLKDQVWAYCRKEGVSKDSYIKIFIEGDSENIPSRFFNQKSLSELERYLVEEEISEELSIDFLNMIKNLYIYIRIRKQYKEFDIDDVLIRYTW